MVTGELKRGTVLYYVQKRWGGNPCVVDVRVKARARDADEAVDCTGNVITSRKNLFTSRDECQAECNRRIAEERRDKLANMVKNASANVEWATNRLRNAEKQLDQAKMELETARLAAVAEGIEVGP